MQKTEYQRIMEGLYAEYAILFAELLKSGYQRSTARALEIELAEKISKIYTDKVAEAHPLHKQIELMSDYYANNIDVETGKPKDFNFAEYAKENPEEYKQLTDNVKVIFSGKENEDNLRLVMNLIATEKTETNKDGEEIKIDNTVKYEDFGNYISKLSDFMQSPIDMTIYKMLAVDLVSEESLAKLQGNKLQPGISSNKLVNELSKKYIEENEDLKIKFSEEYRKLTEETRSDKEEKNGMMAMAQNRLNSYSYVAVEEMRKHECRAATESMMQSLNKINKNVLARDKDFAYEVDGILYEHSKIFGSDSIEASLDKKLEQADLVSAAKQERYESEKKQFKERMIEETKEYQKRMAGVEKTKDKDGNEIISYTGILYKEKDNELKSLALKKQNQEEQTKNYGEWNQEIKEKLENAYTEDVNRIERKYTNLIEATNSLIIGTKKEENLKERFDKALVYDLNNEGANKTIEKYFAQKDASKYIDATIEKAGKLPPSLRPEERVNRLKEFASKNPEYIKYKESQKQEEKSPVREDVLERTRGNS